MFKKIIFNITNIFSANFVIGQMISHKTKQSLKIINIGKRTKIIEGKVIIVINHY